jgi:hypothetical protein
VFEWNGSAWMQLGADIDGEATGDQSGFSVSLDGDRLAIGAYLNDGNGSSSGHARVYAGFPLVAGVAEIPTMSEWGLIAFTLLLASLGITVLYRKRNYSAV